MPDAFLRIAEMTIALRGGDGIVLASEGAISRFLSTAAEAAAAPSDVVIDVRRGAIEPSAGDLVFDSGAVWKMYREGDGWRIDCTSVAFGDGPYKIGRFSEDFTRGEIVVREDVGIGAIDFPLDEVLVANLLGRGRGVELHSCGVIDADGRGHLFCGVSGAGKTTTARLWEGEARGIVSDDRVIVRERNGAMWMFGTPWHGEAELSMPGGAPLAGVYLLVQATENELRTLPASEAVARLFGCTFPPFFDAGSIDFTLSFLGRLTAAVPVRELRFRRDPSVVALVRQEAA